MLQRKKQTTEVVVQDTYIPYVSEYTKHVLESSNTTIIKIPEDIDLKTKYLSDVPEFKDKLPAGLLDKVITGCGLTTCAIVCREAYVIAIPFKSMYSKADSSLKMFNVNVFCATNKTTLKELETYVNTVKVVKILVTYDSLPYLTALLSDIKLDVKQINLLVDEAHLLTSHYSFRDGPITGIGRVYDKYKQATFMSATLYKEEFVASWINELPKTVLEWTYAEDINCDVVICTKTNLLSAVAEKIIEYIEPEEEDKLCIFINSINDIEWLIDICELKPEDCRVIYGKSNDRVIKVIINEVEYVYENSDIGDRDINIPKITFATSTLYEGSDLFGENTKSLIVANTTNGGHSSYLDPYTSMIQISGRYRDSKYKNNFLLYTYLNERPKNITYFDMFDDFEDDKKIIEAQISKLNRMNTKRNNSGTVDFLEVKRTQKVDGANDYYFDKKEQAYFYDETKARLFLFEYFLSDEVYISEDNLNRHLYNAGISVNSLVEYNGEIYETGTSIKKKVFLDFFIDELGRHNHNLEPLSLEEKDLTIKNYSWCKEVLKYLTVEEILVKDGVKHKLLDLVAYRKGDSIDNRIFKQIIGKSYKSKSRKFKDKSGKEITEKGSSSSSISIGNALYESEFIGILTAAYKRLELDTEPTFEDIAKFFTLTERSSNKKVDGKDDRRFAIRFIKPSFKNIN